MAQDKRVLEKNLDIIHERLGVHNPWGIQEKKNLVRSIRDKMKGLSPDECTREW